MSRKILLLAYHFPPIGGAGAQRNTKLARHLPEFGYELVVVTGPLTEGHRWAPIDTTLADEIGDQVTIHRLPPPEPPWSSGSRRRLERWLRLQWPWQRWWEENAIPLATRVGADADLVYCSLAPFATAQAAVAISRRLNKPLVLDLEDPWALDEMIVHETGLHRRLELGAMRRTLAAADAIVMNTPESERRVTEAFPELAGKRITSIVNGYDADDFPVVPPPREPDSFRIVHTGTLHGGAPEPRSRFRRLLGGSFGDVNVRSRSLIYLMRALEELTDERTELVDRIQVHLAGRVTAADRAQFGDRVSVHEYGFLSHGETAALIASADLLFLPMHDVPAGHRVAIVPCKTYEYIGSRRPILAAVPDGDARDLLETAGSARLTRPTDLADIRSGIAEALDRYDAGLRTAEPDPSLLRCLERRHLTAELADFLEPFFHVALPGFSSSAVDLAGCGTSSRAGRRRRRPRGARRPLSG